MWLNLRTIVSLMIFVTVGASAAQAQNTNVYNGKYYNNASNAKTSYNSSKGSAISGPISIKNMIRGAKANSYSRGKSGITPYNLGGVNTKKSYSQTSTPQEIRERRARDKAEREMLKKKKYDYEVQENARLAAERSQYHEATNKYKNQFQTKSDLDGRPSANRLSSEGRTVAVKKKKSPIFNSTKNAYEMPKRVFNGYN